MVSGDDVTLTTSGSSGCYGFIDLSRRGQDCRRTKQSLPLSVVSGRGSRGRQFKTTLPGVHSSLLLMRSRFGGGEGNSHRGVQRIFVRTVKLECVANGKIPSLVILTLVSFSSTSYVIAAYCLRM